jgi:hypothetical protein
MGDRPMSATVKETREKPVTLLEMIWVCELEAGRREICIRCHESDHLDYVREAVVFAAIPRFLRAIEPEMPAIRELIRKKRSA